MAAMYSCALPYILLLEAVNSVSLHFLSRIPGLILAHNLLVKVL